MRIELQNQLAQKFPEIFRDFHGDPSQTCMAFGVECGDGWFNLIDRLCTDIQSEVDLGRKNHDLEFVCSAEQIKEKYGTLRFYLNFSYAFDLPDDKMKALNEIADRIYLHVNKAEKESAKTCSECGDPCTLSNDIFPIAICHACDTLMRDAISSKNYD